MRENINFNMKYPILKGKYTIQLFDENDNLIEEKKNNNCINKSLFSTAFNNFMLQGIINNDCMYNTPYGSKVISSSSATAGLVRWLYITKSDIAEADDYKNPLIIGETIGYAHSTDTNSYDYAERGLPNGNEISLINNYVDEGSKIKSKTLHLVWDFGTDKGNGTFDNLYLRCNSDYSSITNLDKIKLDNLRKDKITAYNILLNSHDAQLTEYTYNHFDGGSISQDDENVYIQSLALAAGPKVEELCYDTVARIRQSDFRIDYILLQVPSQNSNEQSIIVQGGGYFWRIESDYTCTRYTLSGVYTDTLNISSLFSATKVDIPNLNKNYIDQNYHFTGDESNIYISYKDVSGNYYIVAISSDKNKICELISTSKDNIPRLCVGYVYGKKYIYNCNGGETFNINNSKEISNVTGELGCIFNDGTVSFFSKNGYLYMLPIKNIFSGYKAYDKLEICTFVPWTSHVKLDTPITKTSANTMKIQYDITCEYVPVGGIENIE